jgi:chemosensory pili system protein ChpC
MSETESDIRGVLISVTGGRLLLPNASVAEVITFSEPEPVGDASPWLLGRVRWRGWRLPVLSFARLASLGEETGELGSKVVVIKALGGNDRLPFFALLTQGFPRLVTVSRERLIPDIGSDTPLGVLQRVMLNDDPALVPDLDTVEMLVSKALQKAA